MPFCRSSKKRIAVTELIRKSNNVKKYIKLAMQFFCVTCHNNQKYTLSLKSPCSLLNKLRWADVLTYESGMNLLKFVLILIGIEMHNDYRYSLLSSCACVNAGNTNSSKFPFYCRLLPAYKDTNSLSGWLELHF